MTVPVLTEALARSYARIALGHVGREYPNKLDHVLTGPDDLLGPKELHPLFFGSLDWHSCVHGFWLLARLRARFPQADFATEIDRLLQARISAEAVAGECAYLQGPARGGFERPYGWAWLLMLAAELARQGSANGLVLRPLTEAIAARFREWLPKATFPIRAGTHANTAFALALALDYAGTVGDGALRTAVREKALDWYGSDADCQAWEPSGEDFLSPALMEAECVRRVLAADAFAAWFGRFLPRLAEGEPAALFRPAVPSDRSDGRIVHLDGLSFSRAWCWRLLADSLPDGDPRRARAIAAAQAHLEAGLPHVSGDYMGEHWLASFAVLALDQGQAA